MNTPELERILRIANVPEKDAEYWEQFPAEITRRLQREGEREIHRPKSTRPAALLWGLGLATVCLLVGFAMGFWNGRRSQADAAELAAMRTYFREVMTLFPNQVQAIVIDEKGPRLVLAEAADVPRSPPLFLRICGPTGCKRYLTFSGQQIRVNGDTYEVLADGEGGVILLGARSAWASAQPSTLKPGYEVEARPLEMTL